MKNFTTRFFFLFYSLNLLCLITICFGELRAEEPSSKSENEFVQIRGRTVIENTDIEFKSPINASMDLPSGSGNSSLPPLSASEKVVKAFVGDLDCDGKVEILFLLSNYVIRSVEFSIEGALREVANVKLADRTVLSSIVVGNFDREGCANDFVFFDRDKGFWTFLGKAGEQYGDPYKIKESPVIPNSLAAADLDGDYLDDLVYSSNETGMTYLSRGMLSNGVYRTANNPFAVVSGASQILKRLNSTNMEKSILAYARDGYNLWQVVAWNSFNGTPTVTVPLLNPTSQRWDLPLVGDFNGDGYGDIIMRGTRAIGWWAFYGSQFGYIGRPIKGPFSADAEVGWVEALDINGDGSDDIIWSNGKNSGASISLSTPALPLSDVKIQFGSESVVTTDFNGNFSTTVRRQGSLKVKAEKAGFAFAPTERDLFISGAKVLDVGFVGQRLELLKKESGRPVRIGVDGPGPYICNGFLPHMDEVWGRTKVCPAGYAAVSIDDGFGTGTKKGLPSWTMLSCCRLPSNDILTGNKFKAEAACPEGSIVVGTDESKILPDSSYPLICAEVNSERYRLGNKAEGVYWGSGQSLRGERTFLPGNKIPIAAFYGVARAKFRDMEDDGCLGSPVGSLMVGRGVGDCTKHFFSSLLYRGRNGDPPDGTPVPIFPKCTRLENPFDPSAGCDE